MRRIFKTNVVLTVVLLQSSRDYAEELWGARESAVAGETQTQYAEAECNAQSVLQQQSNIQVPL